MAAASRQLDADIILPPLSSDKILLTSTFLCPEMCDILSDKLARLK